MGVTLPPVRTKVSALSGGQRQAVAITRAVLWGSHIVIMDEPAAALGVRQTELVLSLVERLKSHGVAIVFISHNMQHVLRVADRIAVFRLGEKVADFDVRAADDRHRSCRIDDRRRRRRSRRCRLAAVRIVGYSDVWSVAPGERIQFMVSTVHASFDASIVRLYHGDPKPGGPGLKVVPVETTVDGTYDGREQPYPLGSFGIVEHAPDLDPDGPFTVSAWIYPTTPANGFQGLVTKRSESADLGWVSFSIPSALSRCDSTPSSSAQASRWLRRRGSSFWPRSTARGFDSSSDPFAVSRAGPPMWPPTARCRPARRRHSSRFA